MSHLNVTKHWGEHLIQVMAGFLDEILWEGSSMKTKQRPSFYVKLACFLGVLGSLWVGVNPAEAADVTLTASSTEGGSVTVPGEGVFSYPTGTVVAIEAIPDTCYEFVRWTGTAVTYGKVADPYSPKTVVTLPHSKTLIAHFEFVCPLDATLTTSSTEGGSVTLPGEGAFTYPTGTEVTVEATAETCYRFVGWTGTAVTLGRVADPSEPSTAVTLWEDLALIANFEFVCPTERIKVRTDPVLTQDVTCTSAILRGSICTDGGDPDCWVQFRYFKKIETFTQGTLTPTQAIWAVDGTAQFSQMVEGLEPGCTYVYQAIAENSTGWDIGEYVEFTTPDCACTQKVLLTVSTCSGGQILVPGPGSHLYDAGAIVQIKARAYEGYEFLQWEGSAVDANSVADPNAAETAVLVHTHLSVRARFVCVSGEVPKVIYVDDNAALNCVQEGSQAHPYAQVQVGIHAARQGDTVVVLPGVYFENVDFLGKCIRVMSLATAEPDDPNALGAIDRTILHGQYAGPVVVFKCGEDANTLLSGFTIMGGRSSFGGGIRCYRSSPTISNCVITGNRATRGAGGAVDCIKSESVFLNCTLSDNDARCEGAGVASEDSRLLFLNCIVWGNQPDQIAVLSGQDPFFEYSNIQGRLWPGAGNLSEDPLFSRFGSWNDASNPGTPVDADAPNAIWTQGDYHVRSEAGRYDPVLDQWLLDLVTSPCIDLGHPQMDVAYESASHGARINMGAYGGTRDASRTH